MQTNPREKFSGNLLEGWLIAIVIDAEIEGDYTVEFFVSHDAVLLLRVNGLDVVGGGGVITPGDRLAEFSFRCRILLVPGVNESRKSPHCRGAGVEHLKLLALGCEGTDQTVLSTSAERAILFVELHARIAVD
jgi:hypothetical protein